MSSSRAVGLYWTLLLAILCEASEDPALAVQREVTDIVVDEDLLQKELSLSPEELETLMMQRPIIPNLSKVMAADSLDMTQREATNFHPENVPKGHQVFRPRSMGPVNGSEVDFPPSFPNAGNLNKICLFSNAPVKYPKDMLPSTGFSYAVRQAEAINQLQSWYSVCCRINGTEAEKICCAVQAWKRSMCTYCTKEFSIKTSHYFCCKKRGKARWKCFENEASDSSYDVPPRVSNVSPPRKIRGFKYNSSACKGVK
ncbi:extracellular matrix protein 1 isoform X2 [Pimephales promelas]|uniref:extracellular matrix protein 1 isoform X2 n=1 Tax=Pimephales promelas TaxID=90988 RepID=UPI001955687E|nr:extracellular matrix protein 1 isoform X2 [Pimephales promelas]KAG1940079.1 extracellular matrix protein [Pimephales promelas]